MKLSRSSFNWSPGQRVDSPAVADRELQCLVCKGEIKPGESYWKTGTPNEKGVIEFTVPLHPECTSLLDRSVLSRVVV